MRAHHQSGVIDQHVNDGEALGDGGGAGAHRGKRAEIQFKKVQIVSFIFSYIFENLRHRLLSLLQVAAGEEDDGAASCGRLGRLLADAGVGAGDENGLAGQTVGQLRPAATVEANGVEGVSYRFEDGRQLEPEKDVEAVGETVRFRHCTRGGVFGGRFEGLVQLNV